MSEDRLTVKEAAAYVGVSAQHLYQLRHNGRGPRCSKLAHVNGGSGPRMRIFYTKTDLDEWDALRLESKKAKAPSVKEKPKAASSSRKPKLKKAA